MKVLNRLKVQHKCLECSVQKDNFFCHLRQSNLQIFESLKVTNFYPKGTILFMEGQPSNGIYILCQGRVKLSACSSDGKVIIMHIAEAGEILGLSAAVSDSIHIATAEVLEPCQANFVRNDEFLMFLKQNSEACLNALKQLSENYNTAYLQICSLGLSGTVADKLAKLFLGWCKASAEDSQAIHLKISFTHEEIAAMIGTSRETVTRLLKDFRDRHLITLKGSDLTILDKKKLEQTIGKRYSKK